MHMHTNAYRRPLSPRPHPLHTHSRTHLGKNISARKRVRATDHPFPLSNQQMSNVSWLFSLPCAFPLRLAPRDGHERGGAGSAGSANRSIDGRVPARVRSLAKRRQISDSVSGRNGLHDPHQLNAPTRKSAAQCCWVVCTMAQRAFRMVGFGGCNRSLASGALPR